MDYKNYYKQAVEIFEDVKNNITYYQPEKSLYLLDEAVNKFLKSLLLFYEIDFDSNSTNEELIELLENNTTIKLPSFKDFLIDLSYSYCEGGCSTYLNFKELPTKFIQPIEDFKEFIIEEIGIYNLE
ncbi:HEPN domain-containing protein [Hydrogenothermus marinus]|uniref:HEPN domain-containing protein n=1 Tax=Hydrogenothermus marinus TaxID=133270 RepID=A0A3M0B9N8_9AQUI|nr:HEPN domain-containing protein [Hydrogenothermus marinus]RMA93204.1 HEPN domain-containing protein [Hydrogenothermus marinus]